MTETQTTIKEALPKGKLRFKDLQVGEAFTWPETRFVLIKTGVDTTVVLNARRGDRYGTGNDIEIGDDVSVDSEVIRIARLDITAYKEGVCQ